MKLKGVLILHNYGEHSPIFISKIFLIDNFKKMPTQQTNPTTRFSNRVENYLKYRPHYPGEIIEYLAGKSILKKDSDVADMGSGTGILTELFLKNGNKVYGIEPNSEMRE